VQGYTPFLIDNSYETARYQTWREPIPLRQLYEPPEEQCDLLLTRRMWQPAPISCDTGLLWQS